MEALNMAGLQVTGPADPSGIETAQSAGAQQGNGSFGPLLGQMLSQVQGMSSVGGSGGCTVYDLVSLAGSLCRGMILCAEEMPVTANTATADTAEGHDEGETSLTLESAVAALFKSLCGLTQAEPAEGTPSGDRSEGDDGRGTLGPVLCCESTREPEAVMTVGASAPAVVSSLCPEGPACTDDEVQSGMNAGGARRIPEASPARETLTAGEASTPLTSLGYRKAVAGPQASLPMETVEPGTDRPGRERPDVGTTDNTGAGSDAPSGSGVSEAGPTDNGQPATGRETGREPLLTAREEQEREAENTETPQVAEGRGSGGNDIRGVREVPAATPDLRSDAALPAPPEGVEPSSRSVQIPGERLVVIRHDDTSLEVSLKLENLGKLDISFLMDDGVVHATINATDSAAKTIIESNLGLLLDSLAKEGVSIGNVAVSLRGQRESAEEHGSSREESRTPENDPAAKIAAASSVSGLINIYA